SSVFRAKIAKWTSSQYGGIAWRGLSPSRLLHALRVHTALHAIGPFVARSGAAMALRWLSDVAGVSGRSRGRAIVPSRWVRRRDGKRGLPFLRMAIDDRRIGAAGSDLCPIQGIFRIARSRPRRRASVLLPVDLC